MTQGQKSKMFLLEAVLHGMYTGSQSNFSNCLPERNVSSDACRIMA